MLKDILAFLKSTSFFARENARESLLINAFPDHPEVLAKIDYAGSAAEFVPRMVHILMQHGELTPGTQALWQLLLTLRSDIGLEGEQQIDAFQSWANTSHMISLSSETTSTAVLEFEGAYRERVSQIHRFITLPGVRGEKHRIEIDKLYVAPTLVGLNVETTKPLTLQDFTPAIRRTVILGYPGGGKSTLALKLCHDLASRYGEMLWNGQAVSPVLVILHDYGVEMQVRPNSIADYIESKASSDYQVKAPAGTVDYLLNRGRLLVIFDGLDELVDTTHRAKIVRAIESFCYQYPSTPVVVTSREVGYREAPLDKDIFNVYRIGDFDAVQVQAYVQKWFALDAQSSQSSAEDRRQAFQKDLVSVPNELKRNPLLLSLICAVYVGEGYIPDNRPQIYDECTRLLFSKRDKERHIYDHSLELNLTRTIIHLAYWVYENPSLEKGISEHKLILQVTDYLELQSGDRDQSEIEARKLVNFFTGRAWVFTDTGLKNGQPHYQFTHRTFLEYFVSRYLLRKHRYPHELFEVLQSKIAQGQWTVVAELAFHQMDRDGDGAADELLNLLVTTAKSALENETANLLKFAASCLTFLTPRAITIQAVIETCLHLGINWATEAIKDQGLKEIYSDRPYYPNYDFLYDTLRNLFYSRRENRSLFTKTLEETLIPMILASSDYEALIATEIGLNLNFVLTTFDRREKRVNELITLLDVCSENILAQCLDHLIADLAPKYERLALDLLGWERISVAQFVRWHGTPSLFKENHYVAYNYVSGAEAITDFFYLNPRKPGEEALQAWTRRLEELGDVLLNQPLPWAAVDAEDGTTNFGGYPENMPLPQGAALFGLFTILAFGYEFDERFFHSHWSWEDLMDEYPAPLRWPFIMRSRSDGRNWWVDENTFQEEFDRNEFTPEQRLFIEDWADGRSVIDSRY